MNYIDTHVHLNDEKLYSELDLVIKEALDAKVDRMFVVGWDKESSILALDIASRYDFVYAIIGFHPCNIKGYGDEEYNWLEEAAKNKKVVAIGEIGYDLYWDTTTKEEQEIAFIKQIEIAKRVGKPISIHSRDANQLTFDTVKNTGAKEVGGVLHCYSGSVELAKEYIKLNFIFGIGGTLTFKNNRVTTEVVKELGLKYFITETDSPYLAPTPFRGTTNFPKYIPLVVDKIAELKGVTKNEVIDQVNKNVKKVFNV